MESLAYMSSDDAYALIEQANITKNKQTFLRWVREGKIKGEMRNKRSGYRFKEEDICDFIDSLSTEICIHPLEELERLKKENEQLKTKLSLPENVLQAENKKLVTLLRKKEEENEDLLKQVARLKQDQTIRIRVQ